VRITPFRIPNWESGPQNHPKAKVAVSVLAGTRRSIGGFPALRDASFSAISIFAFPSDTAGFFVSVDGSPQAWIKGPKLIVSTNIFFKKVRLPMGVDINESYSEMGLGEMIQVISWSQEYGKGIKRPTASPPLLATCKILCS
jgi:hypothetical protein